MWIVKLGGSLLSSPALKGWLDSLVQFGDGKVVIVPGGGLFAEAVRDVQSKTGVSDEIAHQMAVVAMDQYATLMTGLNPKLALASSELEIAECGWQHKAIVWKPSYMVLADEGLPKTWDLTSDSLAAWLAAKLNAKHLLVVKSVTSSADLGVDDLVANGTLDPCFPSYALNQTFKTWLMGPNDYSSIQQPITHHASPIVGSLIAK
jgi:aspartokinase-like uncharacterized kinase